MPCCCGYRASTPQKPFPRRPSQPALPPWAARQPLCSDQESTTMFFIRKKLPRSHAPGEPLLYPDHKVPMTRRELLGAGLTTAPAVVLAPAWLAAALKPNKANAATLDADIQALLGSTQCNVATNPSGIPVICFDLAGGANLVGSEVI